MLEIARSIFIGGVIIFIIYLLTTRDYAKSDLRRSNEELTRYKEKQQEAEKDIEKLNDLLEIAKTKRHEKNNQIDTLNEELRKTQDKLETKEVEVEKLKRSSRSRTLNVKPNKKSTSGVLLGTFEATAYDDTPASQGKWVGKTATGVKPRVGVIAVDPRIIPLGTKLYVEGYGNCIAGDTGGDIKGNRLDLFFNTPSEVKKYGRRQVKVYRRE